MIIYLSDSAIAGTVRDMHRFSEFRKRYVAECKTSILAFLLGFLLLIPILAWLFEAYFFYALPVALVFAVPNIVVFSALIALSNSIALRVGTLGVAIALNFYLLRKELLSRIDHFDANGDVLATNQNTLPVIFWQMFLSFAVFYALLSYRRLAVGRRKFTTSRS
ncbi:hypothetical protein [Devosia sp. SL43]|uniref:hypothetical protein n=1 Tax=Devosia sp. SL43 TaxID=2806348 RepID=UPI001F2761AE|nr:hypothetical protein [Devosia sp. SL43]UJW85802.1 hypothetical protein IM737_00395 [Devosia sp. SL43]